MYIIRAKLYNAVGSMGPQVSYIIFRGLVSESPHYTTEVNDGIGGMVAVNHHRAQYYTGPRVWSKGRHPLL